MISNSDVLMTIIHLWFYFLLKYHVEVIMTLVLVVSVSVCAWDVIKDATHCAIWCIPSKHIKY